MDRKVLLLILLVIILSGTAGLAIKYGTRQTADSTDWSGFPMRIGGWSGVEDIVAQGVIDLLRPDHIFNANFIDSGGVQLNLFLGSWSDPHGGPHSPLNCLPASGWIVEGAEDRDMGAVGRGLRTKRLHLSHKNKAYLMDFWYITPFGATSSDYLLKVYEMMTSLSFRPRHLVFVRFVAPDSEKGKRALDRFQAEVLDTIYNRLPEDMR